MQAKKIKQKAFTIIELVVVIAIIGVLATIIMSNVTRWQAKGRDAKRKGDLAQIKKALVFYAFDHGGRLPTSGFGSGDGGNGWATNKNDGSPCYATGDLEDVLDGTDSTMPNPPLNLYISMPHDPKHGGCYDQGFIRSGYMYYHDGSGECAVLFSHLEIESDDQSDDPSCTDTCYDITNSMIVRYGMRYCVEVKL